MQGTSIGLPILGTSPEPLLLPDSMQPISCMFRRVMPTNGTGLSWNSTEDGGGWSELPNSGRKIWSLWTGTGE